MVAITPARILARICSARSTEAPPRSTALGYSIPRTPTGIRGSFESSQKSAAARHICRRIRLKCLRCCVESPRTFEPGTPLATLRRPAMAPSDTFRCELPPRVAVCKFVLVPATAMTKPTARKPSKIRRGIEYSFLFAGIVGVGLWAASNVIPAVWQDWENFVFDRDAGNQAASVHQGPKPHSTIQPEIQANGLIGRLVIPRLHLRTIVREGVGNYTLS